MGQVTSTPSHQNFYFVLSDRNRFFFLNWKTFKYSLHFSRPPPPPPFYPQKNKNSPPNKTKFLN